MLFKTWENFVKNFPEIFFCPFGPSFFENFKKFHYILCSRGPFINFELSNIKNLTKIRQKMWNFEIWWFFVKNCILGHLQAFLGVRHKMKVAQNQKTCILSHLQQDWSSRNAKKNPKNCPNAEPLNLVFYPLIHSGLPNILKLSNFQVIYYFGKLLSSQFQNYYQFCNILKIGHFTGQ